MPRRARSEELMLLRVNLVSILFYVAQFQNFHLFLNVPKVEDDLSSPHFYNRNRGVKVEVERGPLYPILVFRSVVLTYQRRQRGQI